MSEDKPWPKDDAPTTFDELIGPLHKAVNDLYFLNRKADGCEWTGLDVGARELAGCFSPSERLTKQQLNYDEHEQGRDPLHIVLGIAVQLGIEQGRRCAYAENEMLFFVRRVLARPHDQE